MVRIILGVIAGFLAWLILWVGSDAVFSIVSADWGKTSTEFREAVEKKLPFALSSSVLIALLVKSFVVTIVSGFLTAWIAGENRKSTLALSVLLLLTGIVVQAAHWDYMPLWYHVPFLILLIPLAILGGRLAGQKPLA